MRHNEMERRDKKRQVSRRDSETSVGNVAWMVVGGAVVALAAAAVIVSLPDIKRYIRISTM